MIALGRSRLREREPVSPRVRDDALEAVLARHREQRPRERRVVLDDQEDAVVRAEVLRDRRRSLPAGAARRARPAGTGASRRSATGASYSAGRKSVNMLPLPASLSTWISPPSRRAISRLIDRPRPVPPYLRLVVPSACWKASKISCCLSFGDADAGVDDGERDDLSALPDSVAFWKVRPGAGGERAGDAAALGELERVGEQVLEDLLEPLAVGVDGDRHVVLDVDHRSRAPSAPRPGGTSGRRSLRISGPGDVARLDLDLAGLDLRQIEDLVDQGQEVGARGVDRLRVLDLLVGEVRVLVVGEQPREDEQAVERRPQLVGHVREELALVLGR